MGLVTHAADYEWSASGAAAKGDACARKDPSRDIFVFIANNAILVIGSTGD